MFDNLEEKLTGILKKIRGHGTLTESNIQDALREVRLSLLEADVHFKVVKEFVESVKTRALGTEVSSALSPSQEFIRIVSEELTKTMGEKAVELDMKAKPPIVILMFGLQGSGKTTTTGKLALRLKGQGRKVLMVPADMQRPAAIDQLKTLAKQVNVDVFDSKAGMRAPEVTQQAIALAGRQGQDVVLVDTAGRLHVDLELMEELREVKEAAQPMYSLLVVDAMTGQDAVNVASEFKAQIGIDGVVMTKLDGDARGGAALSVVSVVGVPIAFAGSGERLEDLEPFHPERVVSRVLGMGDVLSLIERAEAAIDVEDAQKLEEKIRANDFTLEDFRDQLKTIKRMGPLEQIMGMLPGMGNLKALTENKPDEKQIGRIEAIINSMTPEERRKQHIINGSRRKRIAKGSGTSVEDVNRLLKQFVQMQKMLKSLGGMAGLAGGGKKARRQAMQMLRDRR